MSVTSPDQGYRFSGGRTGYLLIHGLGGTPMEMRFIAQGLARAGHTVVCPQLAGHCGTADDIKKTTWQDWYGTVEKAHAELRRECDVVFVAGGDQRGTDAPYSDGLCSNLPSAIF